MTKWLSLYIQHSYMLLRHKRPATPPQLLHEWPTFRNFAIVKQNIKIYSLDREFFSPREGKNFEFWMLNFELSASRFWIIQFWIVSWRWTRNLSGKSKLNDSKSKLKKILELKNMNTKIWTETWTKQFKTQNWTTQNRLADNSKLKTQNCALRNNSKLKIQNSKL